MPVSAKDAKKMNRRSTASTINPVSPTYHGGGGGKERARDGVPVRTPSRTSLVSFGSAHSDTNRSQTSFLATPPSPPFRASSRSGSYSSIESTLSLTPPSTPGLTLSRSPSVISEDEVDEFGGASPYFGGRGRSGKGEATAATASVIEVRVNDVRVEEIDSARIVARKAEVPGSTVTITVPKEDAVGQEGSKLSRGRGTLKRAWRRVVGSVKR